MSVASTTDTSVAESESQTASSVVESPTDTDDASVQSADVFATQRSEISEVEDALAAERYWNVGAELNGAWQDGIAAWGGADGSGPAPEPAEEVVSNAKPEGDVSSALTEADASIAQPQEDVSIAQTEADASFAQPEEDVSIAQTEADASIIAQPEEVSIAQPEADASIAQPEAGIEECGLAEGIAEEVTTRFSTRVRRNCAIM